MAVHLYHGPASLAKRKKLIDLLGDPGRLTSETYVVVPDQSFIASQKAEILKHKNIPSLIGKTVITWDDMLLLFLKNSLPRVHVADHTLCVYLVFLLLKTKYPKMCQGHFDLYRFVSDLYQFFFQLKSCGLDPQASRRLLGSKIEDPLVFSLFDDYQKTLREYHYYDRGDLYLVTLQLLKNKTLKLPHKRMKLFVSQVYPLRPGHREILRQFQDQFPTIPVFVFYDEDFSQDFSLLDKAFEDLGGFAQRSEYIVPEEVLEQPVIQLKNPFHELQFVSDLIKKQIKGGARSDQIAIVIPDEQYLKPLLRQLQKERISVSVQIHAPITLHSQIEDVSEAFLEKLIKQFHQTNSVFAAQRLKSKSSIDQTLMNLEFVKMHLSTLEQAVSDKDKQDFITDLIAHARSTANSFLGQVVITTPDKAGAFCDRYLFFMGFHLESMAVKRERTLFSHRLYFDTDFVELLESPSFVLKVTLEKIKQLLKTSKNVLITTPEFDFTGKPATKLFLGNELSLKYIVTPVPQEREKKALASDFFQSKKKTFSLSALEEYVKCPYRYYAAYHLKLDRPKIKDIEPDPDIKGMFVHKVMQRLVQENESDYLEGLEYASYREKLVKKLGFLIQEEINKTEEIKNYQEQVISFFAYRVYKTVINLLNIEAENYKTGKKKTLPKYYEWSFDMNLAQAKANIKGRVDRVDVCPASKMFSVIDYKTGTAPTLADIKAGRSLQLVVYLMAVSRLLCPDHQPTGGYYYLLKTNDIKGFSLADTSDAELMHKRSQISDQMWQDVQDLSVDTISQSVANIHEGNFSPQPVTVQLCRFCDYKRICGYRSS